MIINILAVIGAFCVVCTALVIALLVAQELRDKKPLHSNSASPDNTCCKGCRCEEVDMNEAIDDLNTSLDRMEKIIEDYSEK